jgi:hypothetical protein
VFSSSRIFPIISLSDVARLLKILQISSDSMLVIKSLSQELSEIRSLILKPNRL